jgi:hypothetical protein
VEEPEPYKPPVAQNLEPLGSLAQAARGKEINQAQRILIVIGALTMALNGFFLSVLDGETGNCHRAAQNVEDPIQVLSINLHAISRAETRQLDSASTSIRAARAVVSQERA